MNTNHTNLTLFDSHAHLPSPNPADVAPILARAAEAGVSRIAAIGGDPALNSAAAEAAKNFPASVCAALGFDRDQTSLSPQSAVAALQSLVASSSPAAIGEIGLDFHYSPESAAAQCNLFAAQLELASTLNLPVVIHTRDADDPTISIVDSIPWTSSAPRGVIHCCTRPRKFAAAMLDRGFMISISGIVTFKSAEDVRDVARYVPSASLLLETDSPYLAPVPLRGKTNEPSFLPHVARFVATLRNLPPQTLAAQTSSNAQSLFRL